MTISPKLELKYVVKAQLLERFEASQSNWKERLLSSRNETIVNEDWDKALHPKKHKVRGYNYFDSQNTLIATIIYYTWSDLSEHLSVRMLLIDGIEHHAIKSTSP
jgi:hypothetical protein